MYYLSTAYFPPIQYFSKLYQAEGQLVWLEACEAFVKQTYRSRCFIVDARGLQMLSVPVEHGSGRRELIRDLKVSLHGDWQRSHIQAIRTAYGASPFFEYYWDDIEQALAQRWEYLWEMNTRLTEVVADLLDMPVSLCPTQTYMADEGRSDDFRYIIRPKQAPEDATFQAKPYYQPFAERHGFIANASILDLLFNMGPESLLLLRDSVVAPKESSLIL